MRALLLTCVFSLGVCAMSATAEEKKNPSKKESYDEAVTIRRCINGKPVSEKGEKRNVPAYRVVDKDGAVKWYTLAVTGGTVNEGTELHDKDGVIWVVSSTKFFSGSHYMSTAKKKE